MRELLRLRNVRLSLLGNAVSMIGDNAFWLAAAIWIKELTGSTAQTGVATLCLMLGTMLSPLTGIVVDLVRRKLLLMLTNIGMGLVVLTLVSVHGASDVWKIDAVLFFNGIALAVTSSALAGLQERLVPAELMATAQGLGQMLYQGVRLITPAVGLGVLAAWGGQVLAVMDASTFAMSVLCWSLVRMEDPRPTGRAGRSWRFEMVAGFRFIFASSVLRRFVIASAISLFAMGFYETLGIAVVTVGLGHQPTWVGTLITAMSVTGLAGGLLAPRLIGKVGAVRAAAVGMAACTVAVPFVAVPDSGVVLAAAGLFGAGLAVVIVSSGTAFQQATPNALMGRVNGVANLVMFGAQVMGISVGAWLVGVMDYRSMVYLSAVVFAGGAAVMFSGRNVSPIAAASEPGAVAELSAEAASR